jgi:hypothetical protein
MLVNKNPKCKLARAAAPRGFTAHLLLCTNAQHLPQVLVAGTCFYVQNAQHLPQVLVAANSDRTASLFPAVNPDNMTHRIDSRVALVLQSPHCCTSCCASRSAKQGGSHCRGHTAAARCRICCTASFLAASTNLLLLLLLLLLLP